MWDSLSPGEEQAWLLDKALDAKRDLLTLPMPDPDDDSAEAVRLRALILAAADSTIEQTIRLKWTRLSCRSFAANAVRLQLHALAYNLGNFLRTLAMPEPIKDWSLTTLKDKLIKIGAKVVSHGRYVAFQMAEVAIPRNLFANILQMIAELRPPPDPAPA